MFYKLRKTFFDFFESKGHTVVPSSSLMPDDPSVLLTTAGMQQFKKYYTEELDPKSDFNSYRTTSIQKCFRTSDIDEVGDSSHLTFFEMMGNFAFSPIGYDDPENVSGELGYFKKSAIMWAWEFITKTLNIDEEKLFVTIFEGDEDIEEDTEAYNIWLEEVGVQKEKIFKCSREDNFWGPTGNEGPCGPTTEIHIADSEENAKKMIGVEIWNIVFNEYYARNIDGNLNYEKSDTPGIDTGLGFERLLTVLEKKETVFETSSFKDIVKIIRKHGEELDDRSIRIFADHIRASIFLISDGILPSNKEAGYILRRILRRVIGLSVKYNIDVNLFDEVYKVVKDQYGEIYENINNEKEIISTWEEELYKFKETISKGIKKLKRYERLSGADAFYLYETFGLPLDLIKEFSAEVVLDNNIDEEFNKEFERHREISRAGVEKKFGGHGLELDTGELKASDEDEKEKVVRMHTATHLLQWALRDVLGGDIKQMGSDINGKRLRFDFSFDRKLSDEEKNEVETKINEKINEKLPVYSKKMNKEEAEKIGALAFFKDKYPDEVSVYFIGDENSGGILSKEFCGGPHVKNTNEIGKFKILKEESNARGVRRIKATVE